MAGNDMRGPGHAGQKGQRKALKSFKPPQNPNIKRANQFTMEFGDSFRDYDLKLGGKGGSGEKPRKLEANNIMNNMQEVFKPPQGKITDYIKKFDSKNSSGAIKNHLDVLDKLLKKGDQALASLTGMMGQSTMQGIQQSVNQQQPQCPEGFRFDEKLNKCVMDCPQGQRWDEVQQKCIVDDGTYDPKMDSSTGLPDFLSF